MIYFLGYAFCTSHCTAYHLYRYYTKTYYSEMFRKSRLSVRRKNELQKHRTERRGPCSVKITQLLPVSIPKAEICLFKLSISKEYYYNVHLKTLDSLKEKVEASFTFPQGR